MDNAVRVAETAAPAPAPAQRQRSNAVPSFIFLIFMLFLLTNHNGDEFFARHQYQDAARSLTYQLSNYTAWLNGTAPNFSVPERNPSLASLLNSLHVQGVGLDPKKESYYSNITGFINGSSHFYNISSSSALSDNATYSWRSFAEAYMDGIEIAKNYDRFGDWKWAESDKIALSVVEKKQESKDTAMDLEDIPLVHGRIELTNSKTSEDFRLDFEGVHLLSNGTIHGFAEPAGRHIDIRLLPSLVPESVRIRTARIVQHELEARIAKLNKLINSGTLDQDTPNKDDPPKSSCPFTFHAQLRPVVIPVHLMQELESELQNPTGISTVPVPKLELTGVLVSQDCGILYTVTETEGLRSQTFFRKVATYAGLSAIAYMILLVLFTRQTNRSRTPSGIYRVSRWTFLSQAAVDAVSFAGHITFAILAEGRTSLSLVAPAFLAGVLFVHEAQFSVLVHQIQGPENIPAPSPPPTLQETPTPPAVSAPASTSSSPTTPATVPSTNGTPVPPTSNPRTSPTPTVQAPFPPTQSFLSFFIQHVRSDPQARLWFTLFIFLSFIVRVILSPTLSMVFVGVTYSSFWLPQIARSVRRGRSSGLAKEYVVGTTICRLYGALYFLACPRNVLEVEPRSWANLLALFVCLQAGVLILQELLGPTFFLPKQFATAKIYDYHPPMPFPDPEAPEQSMGDCAICMDAIYANPSLRTRSKPPDHAEAGGAGASRRTVASASGLLSAMHMGVGGTTARKSYSLAPCHHLFHTECLEKWLAIKNICPQCRRPLPPL